MREKRNKEAKFVSILPVVIIVLSAVILFNSNGNAYMTFLSLSLLSAAVLLFVITQKKTKEEVRAYRILIAEENDEREKTLVEKYHVFPICNENGYSVFYCPDDKNIEKDDAFTFPAALSSLHNGECDLLSAYREALFTYEWHRSKNGLHFFEEEQGEITLDSRIRENEREFAKTICNSSALLDEYLSIGSSYPLQIQKALLVSLLLHLYPSLDVSTLRKLLNASSEKILREEVNALHSIEIHDGEEKTEYTVRFKEILAYIASNMNNETLSSSDVCDAFSISQSSLTREFQKNMGTTFSQYLHKMRLKAAKTLLERNIAVKEVASCVGYTNTLALTRAFHKYEGMTPGSYQRMN